MDSVSKLSRKLACWCALYKVFTLWQLLFMLTIPQLVNGKENLASIDGKCLLYPRFLADVRCALVHPFCITWLREQCLAWSIQTATSPSRIENAYQNSIILGHCDFPVVTRWYILMKYYCFFFQPWLSYLLHEKESPKRPFWSGQTHSEIWRLHLVITQQADEK